MYQSSNNNKNLNNYKQSRWITGIIVIALLVFGTVRALSGQSGTVTVQVNDTMLGVLGTYGDPEFIQLSEINDYQMVETVDYGTCVEGEEKENTMSGRYSNAEYGEYTLHVYSDKAPYIVVQYGDEKTIVFNLGSERLTKRTFEDLEEAMNP